MLRSTSYRGLDKIWLQFVQILSISLYKVVFLNIFNRKFVVLELNVYQFQSNIVHTSVRSAS
jgi:uncharacterized membrane protein HdeD (DUF308 family)